MPWITVDVLIGEHPKIAQLPSGDARWGWIMVLTAAKRQPYQGHFASRRHLAAVVPAYARYIAVYLAAQLLDQTTEGLIVVHGWPEYQRDDAGRKAVWRDGLVTPASAASHSIVPVSRDSPVTLAGARGPASALSLSMSMSNVDDSDDGQSVHSGDDGSWPPPAWATLAPLVEELSGRAYALGGPTGRLAEHLLELAERHGVQAVVEVLHRLATDATRRQSARQLVFGAVNALDEIPRGSKAASEGASEADLERLRATAAVKNQRYQIIGEEAAP